MLSQPAGCARILWASEVWESVKFCICHPNESLCVFACVLVCSVTLDWQTKRSHCTWSSYEETMFCQAVSNTQPSASSHFSLPVATKQALMLKGHRDSGCRYIQRAGPHRRRRALIQPLFQKGWDTVENGNKTEAVSISSLYQLELAHTSWIYHLFYNNIIVLWEMWQKLYQCRCIPNTGVNGHPLTLETKSTLLFVPQSSSAEKVCRVIDPVFTHSKPSSLHSLTQVAGSNDGCGVIY